MGSVVKEGAASVKEGCDLQTRILQFDVGDMLGATKNHLMGKAIMVDITESSDRQPFGRSGEQKCIGYLLRFAMAVDIQHYVAVLAAVDYKIRSAFSLGITADKRVTCCVTQPDGRTIAPLTKVAVGEEVFVKAKGCISWNIARRES